MILARLMQIPGPSSILLLFFIFVVLPWVAIASARQLRTSKETPSRASLAFGTLGIVLTNFWLAWRVAGEIGVSLFAFPRPSLGAVMAAVSALLLLYGIHLSLRKSRTEEERRQLAVFRLAPRTRRDAFLWGAIIPFVAISEEAAYRGMGMTVLWDVVGDPWLAAVLCALAFTLGHWVQGWKSCLAIFAIGLVLQGLVAVTGTLLIAMGVHAAYNYWAGHSIIKTARRFDAEAAAVPPAE